MDGCVNDRSRLGWASLLDSNCDRNTNRNNEIAETIYPVATGCSHLESNLQSSSSSLERSSDRDKQSEHLFEWNSPNGNDDRCNRNCRNQLVLATVYEHHENRHRTEALWKSFRSYPRPLDDTNPDHVVSYLSALPFFPASKTSKAVSKVRMHCARSVVSR